MLEGWRLVSCEPEVWLDYIQQHLQQILYLRSAEGGILKLYVILYSAEASTASRTPKV